MPRVRNKAYDELRNIRRRYERAAERFEKQAENANSAVDKRQLMRSAQALRATAKSYYVENITAAPKGSKERQADIQRAIKEEQGESKSYLAGRVKLRHEIAREQMKDSILKSTSGSDFFAATVDIWRGTDYSKREETVFERFKELYPDVPVRDILDVMEWFSQNTGIDYFDLGYDEESSDDERYLARARSGMLLVLESGLAS